MKTPHRLARTDLEGARNRKQGDFFTPEMEALVREAGKTLSREGEEIESTINDENPGKLPSVGVNDRYPDGIPVTTMPGQLLETLPKLLNTSSTDSSASGSFCLMPEPEWSSTLPRTCSRSTRKM